jgi:hypothetical protein
MADRLPDFELLLREALDTVAGGDSASGVIAQLWPAFRVIRLI